MLARPMFGHQVDLAGVRLVEGGVIEDQGALVERDERLGLLPEDLRFGVDAVQEAIERVMSRSEWGARLDASGFRAGEGPGELTRKWM